MFVCASFVQLVEMISWYPCICLLFSLNFGTFGDHCLVRNGRKIPRNGRKIPQTGAKRKCVPNEILDFTWLSLVLVAFGSITEHVIWLLGLWCWFASCWNHWLHGSSLFAKANTGLCLNSHVMQSWSCWLAVVWVLLWECNPTSLQCVGKGWAYPSASSNAWVETKQNNTCLPWTSCSRISSFLVACVEELYWISNHWRTPFLCWKWCWKPCSWTQSSFLV